LVKPRVYFQPIIAAEVVVPMQHISQQSALLSAPPSQSRVSEFGVRRFFRKIFGAGSREVNQLLATTEECLKNLIEVVGHERAVLETRLTNVTAEVDTLRAELTAAEQYAAACREQEALIARTVLTAQRTADDLVRRAQTEADEIVGKAETIATEIVQASCRNASEILGKARQDADVMVEIAQQKGTAWLALLRAEADDVIADAHQRFDQAQRSVAQSVASLTGRLETCLAELDAGMQNVTLASMPLPSNGSRHANADAAGTTPSPARADGETVLSVGGEVADRPLS
jgi:cell division septum initiation protein DivIVA